MNKHYYKDCGEEGSFDFIHNDNDVLHNEDGPARTFYYKNGNVKEQEYFIDGNLHRLDGPASIFYFENGKCKSFIYFIKSTISRNDGPAICDFSESGKIKNQEYFYEGLKLNTIEELENLVKHSILL